MSMSQALITFRYAAIRFSLSQPQKNLSYNYKPAVLMDTSKGDVSISDKYSTVDIHAYLLDTYMTSENL